jgi:hypothetical protein
MQLYYLIITDISYQILMNKNIELLMSSGNCPPERGVQKHKFFTEIHNFEFQKLR